MIDWAAACHIGFLQLLPINEMGSDESPYSAISSAAIDPIYLTLSDTTLPWLDGELIDSIGYQMANAIESPNVIYPRVRKAKRDILEAAWRNFDRADPKFHDSFHDFRKVESAWLDPYCEFKLLMEFFGSHLMWDEWPENCKNPASARRFIQSQRERDRAAVDSRLGYYAFVQWLCYQQWTELFEHATSCSVKLMGDIPIGISWHSCDVFFHQEEFLPDWFGGTPAEPSSDRFIDQWGQNWGIPLYDWTHMHGNNYRWWRTRMRRITRFFHMVRLDHILGFYRIYAFPWHPRRNQEFVGLSHEEAAHQTNGRLPKWFDRPDDNMENKHANLRAGQPRLQAIVEAAEDTIIIAEDLGWVPDYVRPHLAELGIAGYRIPHWDCDSHGNPPLGSSFPELSFAAYSTHDHDPVCAIWRGCVQTILKHQQNPAELEGWQVDSAKNTIRILSHFAGIPIPESSKPLDFTDGVRLRLIKALLDSNSRYACLMITSLFGLDDRINQPGSRNSQNWSFRLPWTTDKLQSFPNLISASRLFGAAIQITNRSPT